MNLSSFICDQVIWFTGLSGSGKSTIANGLKKKFDQIGINSIILDGDNLRNGLNQDLGFSLADRTENIRRAAEIAKLLVENRLLVIASFICPTNELRKLARTIIGDKYFKEVYLSTELSICELRDVKGLYKKARAREINDFSGISSPFETPENPDLNIDTSEFTIEQTVEKIFEFIKKMSK